ncbi:sulfotransferase family 2 domain-containing protein [Aestuariibius sp. 2305UL40-4]|uniref:sulfotransferase family 2 domain-containing protein n=1 Tax=Aestuariibius violaceus TaxID=3234132 RepID=UPI00345E4E75
MNGPTPLAQRLGWRLAPGRMIASATPLYDPALDRVYLKRGLILIHIPKNAGTSVEDALFGYRVRHRTWAEIRESCPEAWAKCPKLAILRDPVDRFLSAYDYLSGGGRNATDRAFGAHMIAGLPIDRFVDRLVRDRRFREQVMRYFHFRPQSDYVCDGDRLVLDHPIPFASMEQGLIKVAGLRPGDLAHTNRTRGARTQRDHIGPDTVERIIALYAADQRLHETASAWWTTHCAETAEALN